MWLFEKRHLRNLSQELLVKKILTHEAKNKELIVMYSKIDRHAFLIIINTDTGHVGKVEY